MEETTLQNSEQFKEVFEGLRFFEEIGMGDLAEVLNLPDGAFAQLEPIFLEEFEKGLNNPQDRYSIAIGLQTSGLSVEDFAQTVTLLISEIDNAEDLSSVKRGFLKKVLSMLINNVENTQSLHRRIIQVPIELISPDAKIPEYARDGDAGMDVFSTIDCDILPGESMMVPLGIKVGLPRGYELQVRPKSGLSSKTHLRIANAPGTIDAMYRDEVQVIVENNESKIKDLEYTFDETGKITVTSILHGSPVHINKGQKIAQLVLSEVPTAAFYQIEDITAVEGNRGGGFGSTGV